MDQSYSLGNDFWKAPYTSSLSQPTTTFNNPPPKNSHEALPTLVVLNVSLPYIAFNKTLVSCPSFLAHVDEEHLMRFVIENLTYQRSAIADLYAAAEQAGVVAMGTESISDIDVGLRAISEFGASIFHEINRLGLYLDGYLHYAYERWIENDLLLKRHSYPDLNVRKEPEWYPNNRFPNFNDR